MKFCPLCKSILYSRECDGRILWDCPRICTFEERLKEPTIETLENEIKETVEDIYDAQISRSLLPMLTVTCSECKNNKAFYEQMQIRAADEPMTVIYKCTNSKCNHSWRED